MTSKLWIGLGGSFQSLHLFFIVEKCIQEVLQEVLRILGIVSDSKLPKNRRSRTIVVEIVVEAF